ERAVHPRHRDWRRRARDAGSVAERQHGAVADDTPELHRRRRLAPGQRQLSVVALAARAPRLTAPGSGSSARVGGAAATWCAIDEYGPSGCRAGTANAPVALTMTPITPRILPLRNLRSTFLLFATLVTALVLTCIIAVPRAASPVAISIDFVGSATAMMHVST